MLNIFRLYLDVKIREVFLSVSTDNYMGIYRNTKGKRRKHFTR